MEQEDDRQLAGRSSTTPEMTDAEFVAKIAAARARVRFVTDEDEPVKGGRLLPAAASAPSIPAVGPEEGASRHVDVKTWEPGCVTCGSPLGYRTRVNAYVAGKTLCRVCLAGNLSARLSASGISFREMDQPLDALVMPKDDPANTGLDRKTLAERQAEYERYMAFLRRFASLTPGERLMPPFAFVYGQLGTGKSAGAERALRDAIRNGCSGRVVRFSDLIRKIYDTYRRPDDRDEKTEDVLRLYSWIHLLVIHEVGPDADSDHALGLFFDFVDARHQACLPTIFTANYAPNEGSLGARMGGRASDDVRVRGIVDRISGGVRDNVFRLLGPSWRGREIAA